MSGKILLNCIFVVEGKHDEERLKKLDYTYVVRTEGTSVPRETIRHLQALAALHDIIILTDPDGPGQNIANILRTHIPSAKTLNILKKDSIKNNTVGVENVPLHLLKEYVLPFINKKFVTSSDVTYPKLLYLGLAGPNSKVKKIKIAKQFHLLVSSLKNMLLQIQLLNINYEDLKEALYE